MSTSPPNEHERQIHTILAYLTLAATLLTISCTLSLILSQYKRASRYFSTRQGAQRRRLVTLFLGLAVACFFVVTALKYVDAGSRAEFVDTLAGRFGERLIGSQIPQEAPQQFAQLIYGTLCSHQPGERAML